MTDKLSKIRTPGHIAGERAFMRTFLIFVLGLLFGYMAKLFDVKFDFLGTLFSEMAIWILLCSAIAVFSCSPFRAALNTLLFCLGMLAAYYLTAMAVEAVWGLSFVYGWTAFSLLSPVFAVLIWYSGGRGSISFILRVGAAVSVFAFQFIFFFRLRITDVIIAVLLYILLTSASKNKSS